MSKRQLNKATEKKFSKFLSFVLRHKPEEIGLKLEDNGWVNTKDLLKALNNHEKSNWIVTFEQLESVVAEDNKGRYSFNSSKTKIRANQGHSISSLKMNFKEVETLPEYLYHGTSVKNKDLIFKSGCIKPMTRQMVHLSNDEETAVKVGKRHGNCVVLVINIDKLIKTGNKLYISENGVYLTEEVPVNCIEYIK